MCLHLNRWNLLSRIFSTAYFRAGLRESAGGAREVEKDSTEMMMSKRFLSAVSSPDCGKHVP